MVVHVVLAVGLLLRNIEGASDDEDIRELILLHQPAAPALQTLPVPPVKPCAYLRADIGEEKRLVHCSLREFDVRCGYHMSAVKAGVFVIA